MINTLASFLSVANMSTDPVVTRFDCGLNEQRSVFFEGPA